MRFDVARVVILAAISAAPQVVTAETPLFPFVVSYDAPRNAANISAWLERPAGKGGFIRAQDGRLVNDAGPVRFFGTNLCFDACFPTHAEAERLAQRLARLGVNVVRMHHMDARSIWGQSLNHVTIDPGQLDRLDYLIHRLKEEGVYTNLNLHVSRWLGPNEGFPDPQKRPNYDKGLDNFEPRMIELQKQYARDLLTHVNPYIGKPHTQEPAIAFVEINNENALFHEWARGGMDQLPEPYAATFRQLWNTWLQEKYGTTAALRQAWSRGEQPIGAEMLTNGDFSQPLEESWSLERDDPTHAEWSVTPNGPDGQRALRVVVRRIGSVAWRPQFSVDGFALRKRQAYTVTFHARSPQSQKLAINCMMAHDPWKHLGLGVNTEVGPQWQSYRYTFIAESDAANARLTFTNLSPGEYEFAAVSLKPGGLSGLAPDERLEEASVAVLQHGRRSRTEAARNDFIDFLWDTERTYWQGMYRYLKEELGVQSLVSGTQLSWSPVHIQAGLDYIDAHAYWQHPSFPGRPWDPRNWYVNNTAMVNSPGGTLTELAGKRVAGLPFTVSEYNHPTPNMYAAEGLPMLAAMAAFQSWDAIYSFAWAHDDQYTPERMHGFFDIQAEPTRLVHLPACAAMLLRGDVPPAKTTVPVPLSAQTERQRLRETGTAWSLTARQLGADENLALRHGVALDLSSGSHPLASQNPSGGPVFLSDNQALQWDVTQPGKGYFTVVAPRTRLFTGFVAGRTFRLGEIELKIGETKLDWATVSLTCLDDEGFDLPGRLLIAATGWRQNSDWRLEALDTTRITLHDQWGREPVLCEGVPATITLPVAADRVTCYALDAGGNRMVKAPHVAVANGTQLTLDPKYKTLWYEVVIE